MATTPSDELWSLPWLQPDKVTAPLNACQISKRGNSLRAMAEAVRWREARRKGKYRWSGYYYYPAGKRLIEWRGDGYRRMFSICTAGRAGTPDDVSTIGALLMGQEGPLSPAAIS